VLYTARQSLDYVSELEPQVSEQANFGGCERFLPEFPQTCPKSFCVTFLKVSMSFFGFEEKKSIVGRHFCPDFQGFCPDFRQIKTFGGALAPLQLRLLHH